MFNSSGGMQSNSKFHIFNKTNFVLEIDEMYSPTGRYVAKRRITDGTSEKELMKAMSTFLNQTGAGDYNLPVLTGENIVVS
jgi:hypothetical protein